jgi:hypothetical protein
VPSTGVVSLFARTSTPRGTVGVTSILRALRVR